MNLCHLASTFLLAAGLLAQATTAPAAPITEERVLQAITFLASDELQGRDCPSPGLDTAANNLSDRFQKAGLERAVKDSWLHKYLLPGLLIDSSALKATIKLQRGDKAEPPRELKPGEELRLLRAGSQTAEIDAVSTVGLLGDPRTPQLLQLVAARRPVIVEVEATSQEWLAAGSVRQLLGERRGGSCPVFLVLKGALPGGPLDDRFEDRRYSLTYEVATPEKVDIELPNVVGVLRGASKPDEYVIVSAHFDHIGVGPAVGGDTIYNGADDDASGTTAVLLLAEAMATEPRPARSIAFVCFSGEEKGLRGSRAFAEQPPFPLDKVVANVNIEMIGRPEPGKQKQAWITGVESSDFAAIAGPALQKAGIELVPFGMAKMLFAGSDNYSLVRAGVVAHSISAGSLHKDYHRPSDDVAKIDIPHMTAVIRGLHEVVREFADRKDVPTWSEAGKKELERLQKRR